MDKLWYLVQNDMPSTVMWSTPKPEVEFQYGGRLFFQPKVAITQTWIQLYDIWFADRYGPFKESGITLSVTVSEIGPQRPPS